MEHTTHSSNTVNDYLDVDANNSVIYIKNKWTLATLPAIDHFLATLKWPKNKNLMVDANKLSGLDSAGAWRITQVIAALKKQGYSIEIKEVPAKFADILDLIQFQKIKPLVPPKKEHLDFFAFIGKKTINGIQRIAEFFSFIGQIFLVGVRLIFQIRTIHIRAFLATIETTGYQALPIIGLLSFLIGVVLAYQMGMQLKNYGANIFIVDLLGISLFREFGPLITAIIVAGRTASAFTAQIGTMKIKEEIDALATLGIMPEELLIIPKCLALLIVLPLLTVWADVFGVMGGMFMAKHMLSISFNDFFERFQSAISVASFVTGISKAPVFGLIIATVGCYQGLQVKQSAESVGQRTTQSVVEAIFSIIVADAAFSILFSYLNI